MARNILLAIFLFNYGSYHPNSITKKLQMLKRVYIICLKKSLYTVNPLKLFTLLTAHEILTI